MEIIRRRIESFKTRLNINKLLLFNTDDKLAIPFAFLLKF